LTTRTIQHVAALRAQVDRARRAAKPDAEVEAALTTASGEPWFGLAALPRPPLAAYSPGNLAVLDFDPLPTWRRVHVPVLGFWGERDAVVPPEQSRSAIEGALREAHDSDATLLLLPNAGHGLLLSSKTGEWDWPRLARGISCHDDRLAR